MSAPIKAVSVADRWTVVGTLAAPIQLEGRAILVDDRAGVTLCPSRQGSGITFRRRQTTIPVSPRAVTEDAEFTHTMVLGRRPNAVYSVEHLLAALSGTGIVDVTVIVDDLGHLPIFDGSCATFVDAVHRAGVITRGPTRQRAIQVMEPVYVQLGQSWAWLRPSRRDALSIDATIEFPSPIGTQRLVYVHEPGAFRHCLAAARTFMSEPWRGGPIPSCPGFPYAQGGTAAACMLTHDGARFHPDLRAADECVRHKLADMIGDLAVLGMPVFAEIEVFRPGHALCRQVIRTIAQILADANTSVSADHALVAGATV
jgi:UDP-3-O-[3-hydroxymyristoyl] N-acetylglucosamine deacetylase